MRVRVPLVLYNFAYATMSDSQSFTEAEWNTCIKVLQVLSRKPEAALDELVLKGLITKLSKDAKKRIRAIAAQSDRQLLASTSTWRRNRVANHPLCEDEPPKIQTAVGNETRRLNSPRSCYLCKQLFFEVHQHYHMHCPSCAQADFARRFQRVDLSGRTALVTGGRIKIGWQLTLRFLRDGASVIVTTRYPRDAAVRFGKEPDFDSWRRRLRIQGLDLRNLPAVEDFAGELVRSSISLDILVNNAAQTIRRPPSFYEHLRAVESAPLPSHLGGLLRDPRPLHSDAPSAWISEKTVASKWMPEGVLDVDGQQVDLTPVNSWTLRAGQISTGELLESILVNQTAPFLLARALRPAMMRSAFAPRFVINVSAMEGQFERGSKTPHHPHTNMAKAALNMFTRTSAVDFAQDNIWMNSVDTGWITNENPAPKKDRVLEEQHFVPPLDVTDGMARIYDPIVRGILHPEIPFYGHFLKNYQPYPW